MPTNFHLAPPAKLVDGLFAVPIDIQSIAAPLVFDGSTQTGTGDATMTFVMPDPAGCPIFDLRQTITAAWLDGVAIPVADVAHHNFGGGVNAELRVVNTTLTANTTHTLRVTCQLGIPQTATAGSPSKPGTSGLHNRPDLFTGADNVVEVALPDQPVNGTQNGESEHLGCGIHVPEPGPANSSQPHELLIAPGHRSAMRVRLACRDQPLVIMRIALRADIATGQTVRFDAVQRDLKTGKIVGALLWKFGW